MEGRTCRARYQQLAELGRRKDRVEVRRLRLRLRIRSSDPRSCPEREEMERLRRDDVSSSSDGRKDEVNEKRKAHLPSSHPVELAHRGDSVENPS